MRTWGEQKPENGGPKFWPQKRDQFLGPKLGPYCFFNRDSKKGPNFGPQKRTIMWPPFQGKFLGRGANFLVPFLGPLLAHKDVFPSLTHKRQICGARIWVLAVHWSFPHSKIAQTHKFLCRAFMSKVVSYLQWVKCCRDNHKNCLQRTRSSSVKHVLCVT